MKKLFVLLALCAVIFVGCSSKIDSWQENYDLGIRYLSEGNYVEAIIAFSAAIEIDSNNQDGYIKRAQTYYELAQKSKNTLAIDELAANYNSSISDYNQALIYDISNNEIMFRIAEIYCELGNTYFDFSRTENGFEDYISAIENYEKSLEYYNMSVDTYKMLAKCYELIGEYSKANEILSNGYAITKDESLNCSVIVPIVYSGICGDNLIWTIDAENVLTIKGQGDMYDYEFSETDVGGTAHSTSPWFNYNQNITSIVVENGVTGIGKNAFLHCINATEILIPESVISIRFQAFYECNSIVTMTLPSALEELGDRVFNGCISLNDFYISDSNVNYSTDNGILYSKDRSSLICYPAGRDGLCEISTNVRSVDRSAFTCCKISELIISENVETFGFNPIWACNNIISITVPDNVTSIMNLFVGYCTSIEELRIGNGVSVLPMFMLYHCESIKNLYLGSSITYIENNAVEGCDNLTDVYYSGSSDDWNRIIIGSENSWLDNVKIHYNAW